MVGSTQGTVHKLPEGQGLAEKFSGSKALQALVNTGNVKRAKAAKKAKAKDDGMAALNDLRPDDTWHHYSQEMSDRFNDWTERAVDLMSKKGIDNIFNSSDPDAMKLRREGLDLKQYNSNINQYKDQYEEIMADVNTRGDKYDKSSVLQAKHFPTLNTFEDVAGGQVSMGALKWKEPTVSSYKETNNIISNARTNFSIENGGFLNDDQIKETANQIISDPSYSEGAGGGYVGQISQSFSELPNNIQRSYQVKAASEGLDPDDMEDVVNVYLRDHLKSSQSGRKISFIEQAQLFSKNQPLESYSVEDKEGVTTSGVKMRNESKASKEAYYTVLHRSPNQVSEEVAEGLYGSINNSFLENVEAGSEYYHSLNPVDYAKKYGIARQGGGSSEKEVEESYTDWYSRVLDQDETVAKEAIDFAFGADANGLKITKSDIFTNSKNGQRYAILRYTNLGDRDKAVSTMLKDFEHIFPENSDELGEGQFLEQMQTGTTVAINISDPKNGQKLRDLYRQSVQTKKETYKPTIDREGSRAFDARQNTKRKNPLIIKRN